MSASLGSLQGNTSIYGGAILEGPSCISPTWEWVQEAPGLQTWVLAGQDTVTVQAHYCWALYQSLQPLSAFGGTLGREEDCDFQAWFSIKRDQLGSSCGSRLSLKGLQSQAFSSSVGSP